MRYTVMELELLAIVHALPVWHCGLKGSQFTVVTDHNPLTFLGTQQGLNRCRCAGLNLVAVCFPMGILTRAD